MCYSVKLALPVGADLKKLVYAEKIGARKFSEASVDPYVSRGHNYKWFYTTKGFCDCGTEIGHQTELQKSPHGMGHTAKSKLVKKWKRKNWSEAKIQRALASRKADDAHKVELMKQRAADEEQMYIPLAEKWVCFLKECRQALGENFFVLKHWESSGYKLVSNREEDVELRVLAPRDLLYWEENVAYFCH
jgi:hypothetical protein